MERYRELAPFDPYFCFFETHLLHRLPARAATTRRRWSTAAAAAKANPQFINGYKPLIASLGHLGELDEARTYLDKLLDLEPKFHRQAVRPDAIRSGMTSIAIAIATGCALRACPKADSLSVRLNPKSKPAGRAL